MLASVDLPSAFWSGPFFHPSCLVLLHDPKWLRCVKTGPHNYIIRFAAQSQSSKLVCLCRRRKTQTRDVFRFHPFSKKKASTASFQKPAFRSFFTSTFSLFRMKKAHIGFPLVFCQSQNLSFPTKRFLRFPEQQRQTSQYRTKEDISYQRTFPSVVFLSFGSCVEQTTESKRLAPRDKRIFLALRALGFGSILY